MKTVPLLASLLLTGLAPAATVMMRFETTVDATEFGGAASTSLEVTYSFDSALASAPSGLGLSYGPLSSLEIKLGSEIMSGTAGSGITIWNDTSDGDQYQVMIVGSLLDPEYTLLGADVWAFKMQITDPSGNMFSDESLPASFNFGSTSGFFQVADFGLGLGDSRILGVNESASTPVEERVPFTLTVIPEPSPLAIFGVAALGAAWIRRRRSR
jgi:hypothetical protein